MVTDWAKFRRLCGEVDDGEDFLESIAACARAATVECTVKPNTPAPDLCLLNLQASRRQAERRGLRTLKAEHWTTFRRLDACCRRRARCRGNDSWASVCSTIRDRIGSPFGVATFEGTLRQKGQPQAHPGRGHRPGCQRGDPGRATG
ncbi:hypothetical protein MTO96_001242 [Rhipicephalus appendiculatus]